MPAAFETVAPHVDLPLAVATRLAEGDPALRKQVALLLTVFGHSITGVLLSGRPRRFSRLDADAQDAWLCEWEGSRIGFRRTVFQALRRLIFSTFYSMPAAHAAIGFRGPLHSRLPVLPWEGPLAGVASDHEPVARTRRNLSGPAEAAPLHRVELMQAPAVPAARGVVQGHEIDRDTQLRADVCVIGTGAGGAVVAARLAEAGYDVVMLEEGGYWTATDFTEDEAEMVPRLYADRGARATDDLAVSILQGRCVGGSTTINWMIMLRTPDWVLEEWSSAHGTEGMRPSDLESVFDLVEHEVHARTVPDDAHAPNNRIILDGAGRLGWRARAAKINAKDCIRAGFCGVGCRYGAKQSTLVTYVPRAVAAGARLYSDVRVERVELKERGGNAPLKRVQAMVLDRATAGPRHSLTVDAPIVVLAAGAIGTPAILQRSALGDGAVGKYLRLHPTSAVIGVYDREIYGAAGVPQSSLSDEFQRDAASGYGFWIECPALLPGLASVAVPGFGSEHRRVMQRFPNLGSLIVLVRDGAERGHSDGDVRVDGHGRARIRYRLGAAAARTMGEGLAAAARMQFATGATEVLTVHSPSLRLTSERDIPRVLKAPTGPNRLALFSAHVNGTCRIGNDPRTSGCTPNGERHGVSGLYVADGSLLPTAPGVNPQETIMAIATVIARRIIERHPGSSMV
ncbi:MAG: GMC family oxidoreductase [Gemmatimonadota bacterium]|nr:GMC family oxidoreductase [Gemmatimonadota bacterium]